MELPLLLISLAVLLVVGMPVALALFISAAITLIALDIPLAVSLQRLTAGINIFSLLAIPFFIFAGDLMYRSGIARQLVSIAEASVGRARGGLGQVNIGASMLFGSVSGSAIANASAMGSTISPMMRDKGYDRDYATNVNVTAAIVGLLIPPSHNMIIYAASAGTGVSIGDLFLAGIFPGILTGGLLMLVAWRVAVKRGYAAGVFPGWGAFLKALVYALPGLMTAIIIIGGILSGIFTATESSAIAVIYTVAVGAAVYRTVGFMEFQESAMASVRITAMVLLIIGAASSFGYVLAILEVPTELARLIAAITDDPILVLLIVNAMLLVLGTFMDMSPLIVITTPIFLPIVSAIGIDPVHFGVIMMLNLGVGLVTPPVGSVLFVGAAVGGISVERTIRTIWPFYFALIGALMLITYIPGISMTLPDFFDAR
ncbi:TRAP transporter large permease [Pacificimonas flava]|uniref:TRAP transporter large permease protein n=1 Tax=Pacificimonas flava TaxID=1234595 RepID=M2SGD9_9SPHN|nr:TRAP transporter large permease [Pacificimonas flava]EMD84440.1 TRAP-type C4-dicarboxylate transport system, large permease component [Pacificimonas flava]MBB5279689.1 tripartite ATP-independent transporter DctM subunit [Pacificimonas flava]